MKIRKSGKIYGKSYFSRRQRLPEEGVEMGHRGPTPPPGASHPGPPLALPSGVYYRPKTLRLGEQPRKYSAASAGRKTSREKDLSGR